MIPFSVLVPYRPDGGHRELTWEWLARRWERLCPEAEVIVESDDGGDHPGHFNHPLAINRAARRARGDVLIVADCDTAFHPAWVRHAVELIVSGQARWVLPAEYHRLTEESSAAILADPPDTEIAGYDLIEPAAVGICWSGLVVVPRKAFELVGGYDADGFPFWGADDVCFGLAMDALWGRHTRLFGAAMHLWHPAPIEQTYGHERHVEQDALMRRYTAAAEDPKAIRAVRFR